MNLLDSIINHTSTVMPVLALILVTGGKLESLLPRNV